MRFFTALCILAGTISAQSIPVEIVVEKVATGYRFLNGPVWSPDDFLLFSDTPSDRLLRLNPGKVPSEVSSYSGGISAATFDSKGNMYVAEPRARRVTRLDKKGKLDVIAERFEGKRFNAPNDLVVRRDGTVYFTDPAFGDQQDSMELGFYGVFRVTSKGEVTAIARWKTRPNGIALSQDGRTLLVSDSDMQTLHAIELDKDGAATNDRVLVSKIPGAPSGVRADDDGNIFVAGKDILIYSPKGELIRTIKLPERPSNLAFGDSELKTIYITAQTSVYRVRLNVKGAVSYLP